MATVGNSFFFDWEVNFMLWLQSNMGSFSIKMAKFFTQFGEPIIIILVVGLIYWGMDKKYGKYLMANIIPVILIGPIIKNIALRRRPYFDHEGIKCLHPADKGDVNDILQQGFSFPSLHASNTIVLYSLVGNYLNSGIGKLICGIIIFFVGLSRIVIGVHYPTDVLFGWIFGICIMFLVRKLIQKISNINWIFGIFMIITFPGFFFCKSTDFFTAYGLCTGILCAFIFEQKKVNFKPAKNYFYALIRVLIGGALFVGMSALLKLPFSKELLDSATTTAYLVRTVRYAICSFLIFGLYPLCFNKGKIDL